MNTINALPTAPPTLGHRLAALLILVLAVGLVYLLADRIWMRQYQVYQIHAQQLEHRLHQLQRLVAMRPELEKAIQTIRDDPHTRIYFLPPATATLAAADLQQRVKNWVESSGGTLLSIQSLPAVDEGGMMRVAVGVTLQGDMNALQKTLYRLESQAPLLFIDNLEVTVRPFRPRLSDGKIAPYTRTQLHSQFDVFGYLRKEASE